MGSVLEVVVFLTGRPAVRLNDLCLPARFVPALGALDVVDLDRIDARGRLARVREVLAELAALVRGYVIRHVIIRVGLRHGRGSSLPGLVPRARLFGVPLLP